MKTYQFGAKPTAAMLRRVLRKAFPGVTFSVTTGRHFGRDYITIIYTDGPQKDEVEAVIVPYMRMDDNRRFRWDATEPLELEVNDELVKATFTSHISIERRFSMESFAAAVEAVKKRYGITKEVAIRPPRKPFNLPHLAQPVSLGDGKYLEDEVRMILHRWSGGQPME